MNTLVICNDKDISNADLLKRIVGRCAKIATDYYQLAMDVRLAEERGLGKELKELKIGLLKYLRLIAGGQLVDRTFSYCMDNIPLLDRVKTLPTPDQLRIADGEKFELYTLGANNEIDHRMVDPLLLRKRNLINQLFAVGYIRDKREQLILLEEQRQRLSAPLPEKIGHLVVDAEKEGAWVGKKFISLYHLEQAVRQLKRATK